MIFGSKTRVLQPAPAAVPVAAPIAPPAHILQGPDPTLSMSKETDGSLTSLRALQVQITEVAVLLEQRIKASMIDATDAEMGHCGIFCKEALELIEDMEKKVKSVQEWNAKRASVIVMDRKSVAFIVFNRTFEIDVELLPSMPRKDEPEKRKELNEWFRNSEYSDSLIESVHWKTVKAICEELTEQGRPQPPHIKLHPKAKLKVGRPKA